MSSCTSLTALCTKRTRRKKEKENEQKGRKKSVIALTVAMCSSRVHWFTLGTLV
jgi:hypothetical protein